MSIMDIELSDLLERARAKVEAMTVAERTEMWRQQRLSWVRGELMLEYPDMTLEEATERALQAEAGVVYRAPSKEMLRAGSLCHAGVSSPTPPPVKATQDETPALPQPDACSTTAGLNEVEEQGIAVIGDGDKD